MEQPPSSVFSSVFGRRKSKVSRSKAPPSIHLPPASPIAEHHPTTPPIAEHRPTTPPARAPTTPQKRSHTTRHSIASSVGELGLQLRRSRSTSLRSATSSHKRHASTTSTMHSASLSPERVPPAAPISASRPTLSISTFARNKAKSSDNVKPDNGGLQHYDKTPLSALDKPKTPFGMAVPIPLRHPPTQKEIQQAREQRQASNAGLAPAAPIPVPNGANPNIIFQHIHELASKRISTLDYLRKAYMHPLPTAIPC